MSMLDAFNTSAFDLVSLTQAMNKLPYSPRRIAELGLYEDRPISTTVAVLENIDGTLQLLPTVPWGGPASIGPRELRKARNFTVPHRPHEDVIRAADVAGIRAFGSEDEMAGVAQVVNDKLAVMRARHDVTHEQGKACGLRGIIYDADGTTVLYNLFTEFGITEDTTDFVLGTAGTEILDKCLAVIELIEDALGGLGYDHIHCLAGKTWFRKFIKHAKVTDAFSIYKENEFARSDVRRGFEFGGITFEEYRGTISSVAFIPLTIARFFPVGVSGLFIDVLAPADFVETVNTSGQRFYAKQEMMEFARGVNLHTQSNVLSLCTIPQVLGEGTTSN